MLTAIGLKHLYNILNVEFQTLEISGHMKIIHGQNLKSSDTTEPVLALFAICCPFGPLPMLDVPPRDYTFKSKHKMDLAPLSMDHRYAIKNSRSVVHVFQVVRYCNFCVVVRERQFNFSLQCRVDFASLV